MQLFSTFKAIVRIAVPGLFLLPVVRTWSQALPPAGPSDVPASVGNVISSALEPPKIKEDWSTPSLKGSELRLGDAITPEPSTVGTCSRQIVRVEWRPGDPIDLYILKPAGVKKPPVILYLYSYPFEMDRFLQPDFADFLVHDGYAAVGFASALTGGRYHSPRPMKEWFVSQLRESLATSAHDVQMILNYLATRGDLDMDRVGMFGDGSGASIAILAAAVDPRIKTLDLLDPWGDWPDWIAKSTLIPENERPDFLKPDWLAAVAPLDPLKWLPQLSRQTVRVQFVKGVTVTPAEAQAKIESAIPSSAKVFHYDDVPAFRAAMAGGAGLDWIKEHVQAHPAKEHHAARHEPTQGTSKPEKDPQS